MHLDSSGPQVGLDGKQAANLLKSKDLEDTISLLDKNNHNMTKQQKELLLWHQRLGHAGFRWIQSLMRKPKHDVGDNEEPPMIPTKTPSTANCSPPRCPACQLSKAHRRNPKSQLAHNKPEMEMAIRRDNLDPGDCVSVDQHQSRHSRSMSRYTMGRNFQCQVRWWNHFRGSRIQLHLHQPSNFTSCWTYYPRQAQVRRIGSWIWYQAQGLSCG